MEKKKFEKRNFLQKISEKVEKLVFGRKKKFENNGRKSVNIQQKKKNILIFSRRIASVCFVSRKKGCEFRDFFVKMRIFECEFLNANSGKCVRLS